MSLLDTASLIVTPNGYKASKLYSVKPTDASGDMTVVRATTATRVNSAGLIESVAINVPRLDYSDGSCPSILVEPQRTNLLFRSDDFSNASWTKGNTTFVGDTLTANAGTSFKSISQLQTTNGNQIIYFDVDYVSHQFFQIIIGTTGADPLDLGRVNFDILNKTITQSITFTGFIKQFTGFTRIGVILPTTILKGSVILAFAQTGTSLRATTTTSTGSVKLYRAQNELGSSPTSYIPTVAATVTRNADVISKTGISSLIGQTEGTLFVDVNYKADNIGKIYLNLGTSTSNYIAISARNNNKIGMEVLNSGVQVNVASTATYSTNQRLKIAMTYKLNDFKLYVNGVLQATDTLGTVPAKAEVILGSNSAGLFQAMDGINSAILWKTALTDDQLELLTGDSFYTYDEMAIALNYNIQ